MIKISSIKYKVFEKHDNVVSVLFYVMIVDMTTDVGIKYTDE